MAGIARHLRAHPDLITSAKGEGGGEEGCCEERGGIGRVGHDSLRVGSTYEG